MTLLKFMLIVIAVALFPVTAQAQEDVDGRSFWAQESGQAHFLSQNAQAEPPSDCPADTKYYTLQENVSEWGGVVIQTHGSQWVWRAWYDRDGNQIDGPYQSDHEVGDRFGLLWIKEEPKLVNLLVCSDEYFTYNRGSWLFRIFGPLLRRFAE